MMHTHKYWFGIVGLTLAMFGVAQNFREIPPPATAPAPPTGTGSAPAEFPPVISTHEAGAGAGGVTTPVNPPPTVRLGAPQFSGEGGDGQRPEASALDLKRLNSLDKVKGAFANPRKPLALDISKDCARRSSAVAFYEGSLEHPRYREDQLAAFFFVRSAMEAVKEQVERVAGLERDPAVARFLNGLDGPPRKDANNPNTEIEYFNMKYHELIKYEDRVVERDGERVTERVDSGKTTKEPLPAFSTTEGDVLGARPPLNSEFCEDLVDHAINGSECTQDRHTSLPEQMQRHMMTPFFPLNARRTSIYCNYDPSAALTSMRAALCELQTRGKATAPAITEMTTAFDTVLGAGAGYLQSRGAGARAWQDAFKNYREVMGADVCASEKSFTALSKDPVGAPPAVAQVAPPAAPPPVQPPGSSGPGEWSAPPPSLSGPGSAPSSPQPSVKPWAGAPPQSTTPDRQDTGNSAWDTAPPSRTLPKTDPVRVGERESDRVTPPPASPPPTQPQGAAVPPPVAGAVPPMPKTPGERADKFERNKYLSAVWNREIALGHVRPEVAAWWMQQARVAAARAPYRVGTDHANKVFDGLIEQAQSAEGQKYLLDMYQGKYEQAAIEQITKWGRRAAY